VNNVQRLRQWYDALRENDLYAVLEAFDPHIEWREAEGNPYQPSGEPWFGPQAVKENLLANLGAQWAEFKVSPSSFHDAGGTVVVEGRYAGTFIASGRRLDAQFCHVWQIEDGKLARFQQYTDTAQLLATTKVQVSAWNELMNSL
jgi:ketosteroid isomerase-like protein